MATEVVTSVRRARCNVICDDIDVGKVSAKATAMRKISLPFAIVGFFAIPLAIGCAESPPAPACEQAAAILQQCGMDLEGAPLAACQPAQAEAAAGVVAAFDANGCAAFGDSKADGQCASGDPFCNPHPPEELVPFTTDGCSMFPDGTPDAPTLWQHCCIEHDYAYFRGGTYARRLAADRALGQCVAKASGSPELGDLMVAGVRLGGTPFVDTGWRWGYGWTYDLVRGYRENSRAQVNAAGAAINVYKRNPTPPDSIEQRLHDLHEQGGLIVGFDDILDAVNREIADL